MKNNLLLIICSIIIGYLKLLSVDGINSLAQYLIAIFQYMKEFGLISIYENILYILPFFIIIFFTTTTIREYYNNRLLIISRLGSTRKYLSFMIRLIIETTFYNTLILYSSILLLGITIFSIEGINIYFIVIIFINLLMIEIIFSLLFYILLIIFDYQHAYLIEFVSLMLCPISGFVSRHLENYEAFYYNFMTKNTIFDLQLPLKVGINTSAIIVFVIVFGVLIICMKIRGEGNLC